MFKEQLAKPIISKQIYNLTTSKIRVKIKPLLMLKTTKIKMPIQINFSHLLFEVFLIQMSVSKPALTEGCILQSLALLTRD